jgi:hypothetical protein
MIFGWRDNPSLSPQECEDHYRHVHMKLARACFDGADGFIAVAYNRVRSAAVNDYNQPERREVDPDIDAFCELYFRDAESMQRAFEQPRMRLMFEDHSNFMNTQTRSNVRIYQVDETVFFGDRPR